MNPEITQLIYEFIPQNFFYYAKLSAIILLAIIWILSISYVAKDANSRIKDKLTKTLLFMLAIISGPFGLFMHIILRPAETLFESNQNQLQKTLLLKEFKSNLCPFCSSPVDKDYIFCPSCSNQIAKECPQCGKIIKKSCKTCPYCGKSE